jgi:hypothetical protein
MSLLAACAGAPSRPPSPPPPVQAPREEMPQPPAQPYRPVVPHPARKPVPPPKPGQEAVATPSSPALLAAPPQNGDLIGIDQHKAARLFGSATEKIEQSPATVWRYKTPSCELDLFFYLDLRSGQMRTLHYAFKGDVDDTEKRQNCLRAIVAARGS